MVGFASDLDNIKKVYHYGQTKGSEFSLVLGFELTKSSENGKRPSLIWSVMSLATKNCPSR